MDDSQLLPSRYYALAVAVMIGVIAGAASLVKPPILAHFRFFFEMIRPEIRQYLVESDTDAVPFSRTQRSLVYQRAKNVRSDGRLLR